MANIVRNINTITLNATTYQNYVKVKEIDLANVPWTDNSMKSAFYGCYNLTNVTNINENVTNMSQTFRYCYNLVNAIEIPVNVTNMTETFYDCYNLSNTTSIPNNVTNMYMTYYGCSKLVNAPDMSNATNVVDMGYTFTDCRNLVNAPVIPNNVREMGHTFYGCSSITDAPVIPNSVINISGAFAYCYNLVNISEIPNSVINMSNTFYNCHNLVNAPEIPDSVRDISFTFAYCHNLVNAPVILNGVTNMISTFDNCSNLVNAPEIPNSVNSLIGTFTYCYNLVNAPTIPNSVNRLIGTFNHCDKLINIPEIPNSIREFDYAFYNCVNISGDIFIKTNDITSAISCFGNTSLEKNVYIPFETNTYNAFINAGYSEAYRVNGVLLMDGNGWRYTVLPNNTKLLHEYLGSNTTITPPSGNIIFSDVTSNEYNSTRESNSPFYYNEDVLVAELNFAEWTNNSIAFAFYNDTNIQYIYNISPNVTNYHRAFEGCTNLIAITIPYTFYEEGSDSTDAFAGASNLQTINIIYHNTPITPNSPTPNVPTTSSIAGAFADTSITTIPVGLPSTVTNISYSFSNTQITNVTVGDNGIPISTVNMQGSFGGTKVTHLGALPPAVEDLSWAFANCYDLETVANLPISVINMQGTFYNDYNLISYTEVRSNKLTDMSLTFWNCQNLTDAGLLSSKVLTNMYETYYNCKSLVNAPVIPSGVINANGLFDGCESLTGNVYFKAENINDATDCFNNSSLEKNVYIPFFYSNNTYSETYNSFIAAGYSETERVNGVLLMDASGYDINLDDWQYTMDENNNVKLEAFIGSDPTNITVPFVIK